MNRNKEIARRIWGRLLPLLGACVIFATTPTHAQKSATHAALFVNLLRAFDLNDAMQNDYAITAGEYQLLLAAWQELELSDKIELLSGAEGEGSLMFYAGLLLIDLNNGERWERHHQKMDLLGVKGWSLTLSRHRTPVRVSDARAMLVDLLQSELHMPHAHGFMIPETLKTEAAKRAGRKARRRLEAWEKLSNHYRAHTTWDKLVAVNDFFNQTIITQHDEGTENGYDYWQSPIETLVRGVGDCDDFAIAKYVSLRLMGVSYEQLRVAIVEYPRVSGHAVLLFYPQNEEDPWVLDNLLTLEHGINRKSEILRLCQRVQLHGLKPVFGINEKFWTVFEDDLSEHRQSSEPRHRFRKFGLALLNSQRLLPTNEF